MKQLILAASLTSCLLSSCNYTVTPDETLQYINEDFTIIQMSADKILIRRDLDSNTYTELTPYYNEVIQDLDDAHKKALYYKHPGDKVHFDYIRKDRFFKLDRPPLTHEMLNIHESHEETLIRMQQHITHDSLVIEAMNKTLDSLGVHWFIDRSY